MNDNDDGANDTASYDDEDYAADDGMLDYETNALENTGATFDNDSYSPDNIQSDNDSNNNDDYVNEQEQLAATRDSEEENSENEENDFEVDTDIENPNDDVTSEGHPDDNEGSNMDNETGKYATIENESDDENELLGDTTPNLHPDSDADVAYVKEMKSIVQGWINKRKEKNATIDEVDTANEQHPDDDETIRSCLQSSNVWTNNLSMAVKAIENQERLRHMKRFIHASTIHTEIQDRTVKAISEVLFQQMSVKKGIKKLGDRAIAAVMEEFTQMEDQVVYEPLNVDDMTNEERSNAIESISLVTEKRDGRVKNRLVGDGRKQRKFKIPEDIYSPTVSSEGIMMSMAIDAFEGRDVATCDIKGAYLNAKMNEKVIMIFRGELVDYLVKTNPGKYEKFVHITKKGKKVLYVRLLKALYGCIQSALLWYELLKDTLEKEGFVVNPYDPCVANKTYKDGSQCTIC